MSETCLLDERSVGDYLAARGIETIGRPVALTGGVSNVVLAVRDREGRDLVVKQSLERLKVAAEWSAPQRRILAEASGLQIMREVEPTAAPAVIETDPERMVLVIEGAPAGSDDWKTILLGDDIDATVAARVGELSGRLHAMTATRPLPPNLESDRESFEALRLDPYHLEVARRMPELDREIRAVVEKIRETRECLVHGDLSPKNMLILPDGRIWFIDFEVAHRGDPVFDVAFLLTHLLLKAVRAPHRAKEFTVLMTVFLEAYRAASGRRPEEPHLLAQIGCLVLARIVGKSPVDYLSPAQRDSASVVGVRLLRGQTSSWLQLLELIASGPHEEDR